jgi:hypothetical protein
MFEASAGKLVDIGSKDIEKLCNHWNWLLKKHGGELKFPEACSGIQDSKRECVNLA